MQMSRKAMKFFADGIRRQSDQDLSAKSDFELLRDLAVEKRGLDPAGFRQTKGGLEYAGEAAVTVS
ncbi:hypothetical protein G6L37_06465 [Agrobacterium rubi]|nr:hypothetical protein [Agrobacterium rubi]NTF25006.1 hypothetical protein [Agrobacterium rubi]